MSLRRPSVAALLAVSAASCSRHSEAPDRGALREAVEPLGGAYCITDVQTDPMSYHFDSPRWVLAAAEGAGQRVLALTIAGYAGPWVSTTVSQHPKEAEISAAVGYNVAELYYYQASAAYTVDNGSYKRLEAYINYARSAWVIREAGCGAVLGTGVSFKPIGVYFAARDTASVAIPAASMMGFLPEGNGGPVGFSPTPASSPSDAGAGGAGTGGAGTGGAGIADAGDQ
jgi:hypothetical protein